jgi:hypothetical protein
MWIVDRALHKSLDHFTNSEFVNWEAKDQTLGFMKL